MRKFHELQSPNSSSNPNASLFLPLTKIAIDMALSAYRGLFGQLLLLQFSGFEQTVGRALKDYRAFDGT